MSASLIAPHHSPNQPPKRTLRCMYLCIHTCAICVYVYIGEIHICIYMSIYLFVYSFMYVFASVFYGKYFGALEASAHPTKGGEGLGAAAPRRPPGGAAGEAEIRADSLLGQVPWAQEAWT